MTEQYYEDNSSTNYSIFKSIFCRQSIIQLIIYRRFLVHAISNRQRSLAIAV